MQFPNIASKLKSATTNINIASASTPSNGQVLTATSSTTAAWQTISSGGSNPIFETQIAGEQTTGKIARFTVKGTQTIAGVKISLGTLPTGADFKVDVRRNGIATTNSIFTSDATIDITTGQGEINGIYTTTKTTIDNGTCAENDVLYVYITQIGSTLSGTDLDVVIY